MIICDTREKKNAHILRYFTENGIEYEEHKLDVGDYMDPDNPHLSIDRKQNLDEVCGNLCTANNRFWREVRRARESGIKLIVLIEHGGAVHNIEDVKQWKSKFSRVTGRRLAEEMYKVHIAYHVEFLFCDKRSTGRRIYEIIKGL